jgi:D-aminopeptidase
MVNHWEQLARAGSALRTARAHVATALAAAGNTARDAHTAGMSEVLIADTLGVTRNTVRRWLGKPRKR